MRIKFLLFFLFIGFAESTAQDRYMVFFTDKDQTPYTLNAPQDFLSVRAIERRVKNSIALDEDDLPVDPDYIAAIKALGIETYFTSKWLNAVLVQMEASQVSSVITLPFVSRVEFVGPGAWLSHAPSNERSIRSIELNTQAESPTIEQNVMIGVDQMHQEQVKGEGVLIAVFDDGFANFSQIPAFEALRRSNRVIYTRDFTTNASIAERAGTHGTRVLSVLCADDGLYKGVAPEASYFLAITEAPGEYRIEEYNWLFAAEKADSAGVDIINSSLGYSIFDDASMSYSPDDMDGASTIVSMASQLASDKGILVVNSAGNTGNSAWNIVVAPADVPQVMSVGSIRLDGQPSFFSALGPNAEGVQKPDLMALGTSTAVIDSDGLYKFQNGTSFSTPLVAGLAAGLLSSHPELTRDALFNLLIRSGDRFESPDNALGYGVPHWSTAVALLEEFSETEDFDFRIYPNPAIDGIARLAIDPRWLGEDIQLIIHDGQGAQLLSRSWDQPSPQMTLDVSGFRRGLYFVQLHTSKGIATQKLLIQ